MIAVTVIGKFLLGGFQWLAILFQALMDFAKRNPWQAALIASLIACALLWRANDRHKDERDRALATVERLIEAQKQATAFAVRMKDEFEQTNREINDETDKSAAATAAVYRERVLRLPAAASSARRADMPEGGISEGADRPSSEAIVPRADLLICADNQARLEAAHEWSLKIQALQELDQVAP